jgi:hypothetical protein
MSSIPLDGGAGSPLASGVIADVVVLRNWPQLLKARAPTDAPR